MGNIPPPVEVLLIGLPASLVVALWMIVVTAPAAARERLPGPVRAEVLEVRDGDTLTVRARIWLGQVVATKVRLAGVDTPELRGRCDRERRLARAARRFVEGKVGDRTVVLRDIRFGKYAGRVVARVQTINGEDLGRALIAAGLGRRYNGRRRRGSWCG